MKKEMFKKMLLTAMCCLSLVSVFGVTTADKSANARVGYREEMPH